MVYCFQVVRLYIHPSMCPSIYYILVSVQVFNKHCLLTCLVVPRLFGEKWRDTVFGFPWGVVRGAWCVARGAWCVVRGAWFRVFSGYFVPLTPPTVSVRSF